MVAILRARGDRSIRSFIDSERGTISRELYVNPDIFEQEMEQIFQRCWLFLGHESQVPNPGDFIISRMGTEDILSNISRFGNLSLQTEVGNQNID